jgi:hypothetical protein
MTFELSDSKVIALVVIFRDQPLRMAPTFTQAAEGSVKAQVTIVGTIEALGRRIIQRFVDYANLYFSLDVDLDAMEAEYIPVDEAERARINLYSFKATSERPISRLPFDMLAQAFFAGESSDDPSFAARMFNLAREALLNQQYIDSFRYSFLLFEALYGEGKFKQKELVRRFLENNAFRTMLSESIDALNSDPIHANSSARSIVAAHPTADSLAVHFVERRGFYFHGNLVHSSPWHPDRQKQAQPLAELCVQIAGRVSHSFGSAMFTPEMNERFSTNAKSHGAIMTIEVEFRVVDSQDVPRIGRVQFEVPGTTANSSLAIKVNKHFLTWAELEFSNTKLLSAVARDKESGVEIFKTHYLGHGSAREGLA